MFRDLYHEALLVPSDIQEHLPTLYQLARGCHHVTEMGTRTGYSTRAFLYAQPEALICYDLIRFPQVNLFEAIAREIGRPHLEFHQANVLEVEISETDLLFIDTFHVYEQLRQELARHANKVRQYLALHDTTTYAEIGEQPGSPGLWPAIEEFLGNNPHWALTTRYANNNGLTILTREAGSMNTTGGQLSVASSVGAERPVSPSNEGSTTHRLPVLQPGKRRVERQFNTVIVIPVHNHLARATNCLRSISATYPQLPLIVVDDNSNEETHQGLRHALFDECPKPQVARHVLIRNDDRQLFARTVNRGLRWAHRMRSMIPSMAIDFIALVHSHCTLRDHWLKALLLGMEGPQVGLVGYPDLPDGQEPSLREFHEPDCVAGPCTLLRIRMLEEIGVLPESATNSIEHSVVEHPLGQTPDESTRLLSWRANRSGWKTLSCHCQLCNHEGTSSDWADPSWVPSGDLQPLWAPCDQLEHPTWVETQQLSQ